MTKNDIIVWLKENDETKLKELWDQADKVREETVGDQVHLRGLVEFSNYCVRRCGYCGLTADNKQVARYRMTETLPTADMDGDDLWFPILS